MLEIIIWGIVGALLGWQAPQPFWAKIVQSIIVAWFKKLINRKKQD